MISFQRFTTEYNKAEDRLRLCAEIEDGETLSLMLTQRLMMRLLPKLFKWMEDIDGDDLRADLMRGFNQRAARQKQVRRAPIKASEMSEEWLVTNVKMRTRASGVKLVFEYDQDRCAALSLPLASARQWLNILFDNWRLAHWPLDFWPDWVSESRPKRGKPSARAIH